MGTRLKRKDFSGPLCPKCEFALSPRLGFRVGMIYECKKCGYVGPLYVRKVLPKGKLGNK